LTVLTMSYVIGHVSGCHLKPAVFIGLCVGGRFSGAELFPYILAHVAGGQAGFTTAAGFAAHGYGDRSPGKCPMLSGLVAEMVLTFFLLIIILGATDKRAPQGFAPIAIGLGLTLIHLIGVPVTNLSVNPARSTGPAVFVVGWFGCSGWRPSRAPCWRVRFIPQWRAGKRRDATAGHWEGGHPVSNCNTRQSMSYARTTPPGKFVPKSGKMSLTGRWPKRRTCSRTTPAAGPRARGLLVFPVLGRGQGPSGSSGNGRNPGRRRITSCG
jgi:hypothetical protein